MLDLFSKKCYLMISSSYNGGYSSVKARKEIEMNMLRIIRKVYMKKKHLNILAIAERVIEEVDKNDPTDLRPSDRENLRKYALEYHAATSQQTKKEKLDEIANIMDIYAKGENPPYSIRVRLKRITGF